MNKVILIGRVGKDPEMKYMPSGDGIANLSLATSKRWRDKDGQKKESTEWHKIVAFDTRAKIIGDYVTKGDLLSITGELKTRKWQDKSGEDRYTTEIVCQEIEMLGSKKDDDSESKPMKKEHSKGQKIEDDFSDDPIPF